MTDGVRIKSYVDAINAEQRRTGNMRMFGVIGTLGAMILSQMLAAAVYARSTTNLFSLHNDLIRSNERATALTKSEMATQSEVDALKQSVEEIKIAAGITGGSTSGGRQVSGTFGVIVAFTVMALLQFAGILVDILGP